MMNIKVSNLKSQMVGQWIMFATFAALATSAFGVGARIDLRPTTPMPPGGYEPNSIVGIDVYLVDSGNPQDDIIFYNLGLDFTRSFTTGDFSLQTFEDVHCCGCPVYIDWVFEGCAAFCDTCFDVARPTWDFASVHLTLPDNGEVLVGHLQVNLGELSGLLDVMNAEAADGWPGAFLRFGSGSPGDPQVYWSAYNGELTGGRLGLIVNNGIPLQIVFSFPANNTVDARQPSNLSGSIIQGVNQVELLLSGEAGSLTPPDFAISEQGGNGVAPFISDIDFVLANLIRLNLSEPIEPGAWTTLTHLASGTSVRIGFLPADANGDGTSTPLDILALIDAINHVNDLSLESLDMDRSGVTGPADILRVIDLLNGAGAFDPWNGASLP